MTHTKLKTYCTWSSKLSESVKSYFLSNYETDNEIIAAFGDLFTYGCISWFISDLIYYEDTHKFYDDHYDDIEDLRTELEYDTWQILEIKWDLKNYLSWLSFEMVARVIYNEVYL